MVSPNSPFLLSLNWQTIDRVLHWILFVLGLDLFVFTDGLLTCLLSLLSEMLLENGLMSLLSLLFAFRVVEVSLGLEPYTIFFLLKLLLLFNLLHLSFGLFFKLFSQRNEQISLPNVELSLEWADLANT